MAVGWEEMDEVEKRKGSQGCHALHFAFAFVAALVALASSLRVACW